MRHYSALEEANRRLVLDVYELVLKPLVSSELAVAHLPRSAARLFSSNWLAAA